MIYPREAKKGDDVVMLAGSDTPFILRQTALLGTIAYRLIGPVYSLTPGSMKDDLRERFDYSPRRLLSFHRDMAEEKFTLV